MARSLRIWFWVTDVGFVLYWLVTALKLIPADYLYSDYRNPVLVAWNWSFFPLDLFISATGFASLYAWKRGSASWERWALLSLALTFCSGLQAISFWSIRLDFDVSWWIPNLYLLLYPCFYIPALIKGIGKSRERRRTL
ncbi:YvaD family protein [Paenibacillus flagellatus]|uniref:YvaD family protein n=1 Tax=Paenibacillus flagellatus TaxID=2211139 RepID=A0A2V5KJ24_9BACL|nr:YvaD family protein [Paenibacillus flagellatus]PYI54590.1 hypothetical protein DLM86_14110 [Paenibacillus flagellatus]